MSILDDLHRFARETARLSVNLAKASFEQAMEIVSTYFKELAKWSRRILFAALAPLVVVLPCLAFGVSSGWIYGVYTGYCCLLLIALWLLLTPLRLALKGIGRLFPPLARQYQEFLEELKHKLFNAIFISICATLAPVWKSPGTFFLLMLVAICGFLLPKCAISELRQRLYPTARAVQLMLLASLLMFHIGCPEYEEPLVNTVKQLLTRLFEKVTPPRRDITLNWNTLKWFDRFGNPHVWYSYTTNNGYRLYDGPGRDEETREQLIPVTDAEMKGAIINALKDSDRIESERLRRLQTEDDYIMSIAERAAREKHEADQADKARQEEIKALSSIRQEDITSQWRTLRWFSNAGQPQVWYSGSSTNGYRLWAARGFDPHTNEELRPVADKTIKRVITQTLADQERDQQERDRAITANCEINIRTAAITEHHRQVEALRAKYLNDLAKTTASIALLIIDDSRTPDETWMNSIASLVRSKGIAISVNPFTIPFAQDGVVDDLLKERNGTLVTQLALNSRFNHLWFGLLHKTSHVHADSHGLTDVTGSIRFCELSPEDGSIQREFTVHNKATAMSELSANEKLTSRMMIEFTSHLREWLPTP